jgi:cytochrome b pre-mRNA-processing protein 3
LQLQSQAVDRQWRPSPSVNFLSRRSQHREAAERAYRRVVEQARHPAFYTDFAVPDTLDGRFELVCLHAFLYLHRLRWQGPEAQLIGQRFFDAMFADFDRSLREVGVGDLSVGKHIKRMAQGFYGRMSAYQEGLRGDPCVLAAALRRNVFGAVAGRAPMAAALAAYTRAAAEDLRRQPTARLLAGEVSFTAPQVAGREEFAAQ